MTIELPVSILHSRWLGVLPIGRSSTILGLIYVGCLSLSNVPETHPIYRLAYDGNRKTEYTFAPSILLCSVWGNPAQKIHQVNVMDRLGYAPSFIS